MTRKLYNLIEGYGSIFDLFPIRRGVPRVGEGILAPNDAEAMRRDWEAVGGDLRTTLGDVVPDHLQHADQAEQAEAGFAHPSPREAHAG